MEVVSQTAGAEAGTVAITDAHEETLHVVIEEYTPAHPDRSEDPYRAEYEAARLEIERAGQMVCSICGTVDDVQTHHREVEWSLQDGYDWERFAADHPEYEINTREDFHRWVNSRANLLPLCRRHHTGEEGIHEVLYPAWQALKYWLPGLPPPARVMQGDAKLAGRVAAGAREGG